MPEKNSWHADCIQSNAAEIIPLAEGKGGVGSGEPQRRGRAELAGFAFFAQHFVQRGGKFERALAIVGRAGLLAAAN